MTGLKQRIFRRRAPGSPRRSAAGPTARLKAGLSRLRPSGPSPSGPSATGPSGSGPNPSGPSPSGPSATRGPSGPSPSGPRLSGLRPSGLLSRLRRGGRSRTPWGKRAARQPVAQLTPGNQPAVPPPPGGYPTTDLATAEVVVETTAGATSFRDRGRLRRRLRFLRRARELAFRDVGGLIFDMRRFGRDRPDLVDAKLNALAAVDQELRALERVLDDRRPIHELREPGLSSCQRCGALHASEDNFCPRCGLQFGGAQAMGEVGGAIAAPPQPPPAPLDQPTAATLVVPGSGLDQAASLAGQPRAQASTVAAPPPPHAPAAAAPPAQASAAAAPPAAQASTAAPAPPAPAAEPPSAPTAAAEPASAPPAAAEPPSAPAAAAERASEPAAAPEPPASAPEPSSAPTDETPSPPPDAEQQTEIYRPHDAS